MNIRQLQAFHATVLTSSFTKAGERLYISQPSISRLVKDLEESTGLQLFTKKKGRVIPTPEGLRFYDEVTTIFDGVDHLEKFAEYLKKDRKGLLRLAAAPALSTYVVPQIIKRFNDIYPDVSIELTVRGVDMLMQSLREHKHDLTITNTMVNTPDIIEEKLIDVAFICAIPEKHRLAKKRTITPADLNGVNLLNVEEEGGMNWTQHTAMLKKYDVKAKSVYSSQRSLPGYGMVASGLCVAILEPFNAALWENLGVAIRSFRPELRYGYSTYYPANQTRTPLAREFAAIARDFIVKMPLPQ